MPAIFSANVSNNTASAATTHQGGDTDVVIGSSMTANGYVELQARQAGSGLNWQVGGVFTGPGSQRLRLPAGYEFRFNNVAAGTVACAVQTVDAATFQATIPALWPLKDAAAAQVRIRTVNATLDFPSISATGAVQDLPVTVPGAAVGDAVIVNENSASGINAGVSLRGWVSAANTVTVRATNATGGALDPASASYRVTTIGLL